jgi:hypothetical protein
MAVMIWWQLHRLILYVSCFLLFNFFFMNEDKWNMRQLRKSLNLCIERDFWYWQVGSSDIVLLLRGLLVIFRFHCSRYRLSVGNSDGNYAALCGSVWMVSIDPLLFLMRNFANDVNFNSMVPAEKCTISCGNVFLIA